MARSLLTCLAFGALAGAGISQVALPTAGGFTALEVLRETGHPYGFAGFAPGATPDALFYAVDNAVWHRGPTGVVTLVRAFTVGARCDLLVRPPGAGLLYYADDTSGVLFVRDVTTGAEVTRAVPRNTFDLDVLSSGAVLVAANPRWPAAGAHPGLWLLDPAGGPAHREVVALTGSSGPLCVDPANGDVLCATQSATFPAPPGSVQILRFARSRIAAAIAGGPPLLERDAVVVATGIDGAFDLAFDDRGDLLVSNPFDGRVERVRAGSRPEVVLPASGRSALGLAFVEGGAATFDAYQPDDGGTLLVATNDWTSSGAVHAVRPSRPEARAPGGPTAGPGTIAVEWTGLPPGQTCWALFNHLPLAVPERELFRLDGAPVWWAVDLAVPPWSVALVADAAGRARLSLPYGGGLGWSLAFQAAGAVPAPSGSAIRIVTSTPVVIRLLP